MHHILNPLLLLLLILPAQHNKSVKVPFTHDVQKRQCWDGVSCKLRTALGFASYCISHLTPPLVLYFLYITHNSAFILRIFCGRIIYVLFLVQFLIYYYFLMIACSKIAVMIWWYPWTCNQVCPYTSETSLLSKLHI